MTPPMITESDLTVDPDGRWNFRGEPLTNRSVLLYFKKNLARDEKGYFILNRWGERREISYLQSVRGCPLIVLSIVVEEISQSHPQQEIGFRLRLDSDEFVSIDRRRIYILNDHTVVVDLPDRGFPARLSPGAMTELTAWLEIRGEDYYITIGGESHQISKADLSDLL